MNIQFKIEVCRGAQKMLKALCGMSVEMLPPSRLGQVLKMRSLHQDTNNICEVPKRLEQTEIEVFYVVFKFTETSTR